MEVFRRFVCKHKVVACDVDTIRCLNNWNTCTFTCVCHAFSHHLLTNANGDFYVHSAEVPQRTRRVIDRVKGAEVPQRTRRVIDRVIRGALRSERDPSSPRYVLKYIWVISTATYWGYVFYIYIQKHHVASAECMRSPQCGSCAHEICAQLAIRWCNTIGNV